MQFNQHSGLKGGHAPFSPSQYHWINYDVEKMLSRLRSMEATELGTRLHEYAAESISLGQRLQKSQKTLNMYVNDAIGFKMVPEQVLYYSDYFWGTCDAINQLDQIQKKKFLRIHDLKTGITPAHMEQLELYAALFCLEYQMKPTELEIELRLYQSDDITISRPDADTILHHMDKIVTFDRAIKEQRRGE